MNGAGQKIRPVAFKEWLVVMIQRSDRARFANEDSSVDRTWIGSARSDTKRHVTAGAGGFVDITAHAKKIVFSGYLTAGAKLEVHDGAVKIAKEGKVKKLVEAASTRS
jgi:hypothetical protein